MRAMGKTAKLIARDEAERATSPVMDWAVWLTARHGPSSCAAADKQKLMAVNAMSL